MLDRIPNTCLQNIVYRGILWTLSQIVIVSYIQFWVTDILKNDRCSEKIENLQKQSSEGVLLKRFSSKFRKIHRKIPVSESLF